MDWFVQILSSVNKKHKFLPNIILYTLDATKVINLNPKILLMVFLEDRKINISTTLYRLKIFIENNNVVRSLDLYLPFKLEKIKKCVL